MAGSPNWKVFTPLGNYVASCKEPEAAAALAAFYGEGTQIRFGHAKKDTVFTDGVDGDAGESYDDVARICLERIRGDWRGRKAGV